LLSLSLSDHAHIYSLFALQPCHAPKLDALASFKPLPRVHYAGSMDEYIILAPLTALWDDEPKTAFIPMHN
jgi:hypothetical protein